MPPPPHGDELPPFPPSKPHSTHDVAKSPADPAAQIPPDPDIDVGILNYDFMFDDVEPIYFDAPADVPEDRLHWSMDADLPGVNDAAAAPPVPVGGGGHADVPCCAAAGTTEIQHLEEEDADQRRFDSWKSDVEQRLFGEVDPLPVPHEKLVEASALAPAPEDGRPSGTDADMPEVNAAATQSRAGSLWLWLCGGETRPLSPSLPVITKDVEEEAERRFGSFKSAVEQDININTAQMDTRPLPRGIGDKRHDISPALYYYFATLYLGVTNCYYCLDDVPEREISKMSTPWYIVRFIASHLKSSKPQQGQRRWKEKSMKGMRAVAHPSLRPGQRYVGLKRTLELDDDGNGNRWRAHEYTPLVPSDDGSDKLVPAEISLRIEFKDEPPASSSSSKRSRTGAPKDGPKLEPSQVWDHMTRLHVKVTPKDGSRRKEPYYKVMYAICHHCDQFFNADSKDGTHNLSKHLKSCECNCTHSHSH